MHKRFVKRLCSFWSAVPYFVSAMHVFVTRTYI